MIVVDVFPRGPKLDCSSSDAILRFLESEMLNTSKTNCRPHILVDQSLDFRMVGREDAIRVAQDCFKSIIDAWLQKRTDRTKYPIPVCSGISGLGKTRMLEEGSSLLRNMGLDNIFSVIVPYFNGFGPQAVETCMSIQASF